MDFNKVIKSDREAKVKSKFEGTFLDYLDMIKKILIKLSFLIRGCMTQ